MKYIFFQHQFLENLLGKQGFYKSPQQIDEAIHFASLSRFQELYGDDAEYRPGEPLPRRAYQLTQNISDKLQPFLRETLVYVNGRVIPPATYPPDTTNFAPPQTFEDRNKFVLPNGWVHPTAMHFISSIEQVQDDAGNYLFPGSDVTVVDDDKFGRRRRSKIVAPAQAHPIAQITFDGYRIFPLPEGYLYVKYLGLPVRPKYATVLDPDLAAPVYDDVTSVDTGWPEIEHNDLMMKAAAILGVPLQDGQLMAFARYMAQAGA